MKKTLTTLALASAALFGQIPDNTINGQVFVGNSNPFRLIEPTGRWMYCEKHIGPAIDCAGFTAGMETYRLRLKAFNASTHAYLFTLVLARALDGQTIRLPDLTDQAVIRHDDEDGYTDFEFTAGAPLSSWEIIAEEQRNQ